MKVWVTRDEPADGPLCIALKTAKLDVLHEPVLQRTILTDAKNEIARLSPNDWLVLTSTYAIKAVAEDVARVPKLAVVGEASRIAAERRGFRVMLVSSSGTSKELFDKLFEQSDVSIICYPRSSLATLPKSPPRIKMTCPVLYETSPREYCKEIIQEADVVSVTSASAVHAVGPIALPFASIGPSTTKALHGLGVEPWVEAAEPSFDALASVIADHR